MSHRFGLDDVAPKGIRVTPSQALDILVGQGLDDVSADDLETYRLVMSPARFKQLEHRLAEAIAAHANQPITAPEVQEVPLPFGTDLEAEVALERRRRLTDRGPDRVLRSWTIHDELAVPGRLRLRGGREFSVWGFRGRLLFRRAVTTDSGACWVDGWDEDGRCRSIDIARVRIVHRKPVRGSLRDRATRQ